MQVVSYNVCGLHVGHNAADKARCFVVDTLLDGCDIICLQETWLAKQDLGKLNALHKDFHGAGESTTDLSTWIVQGRILWNSKYDPLVMVVRLNVDWAIGLEVNYNKNKFGIINIYIPYKSNQSEDEFMNRLAFVHSYIENNELMCFCYGRFSH